MFSPKVLLQMNSKELHTFYSLRLDTKTIHVCYLTASREEKHGFLGIAPRSFQPPLPETEENEAPK